MMRDCILQLYQSCTVSLRYRVVMKACDAGCTAKTTQRL